MPDNLTPEEAAAFLRLHVKTLMNYARAGVIPSVKLGRKRIFRKATLDAWLQKHEGKS